MIKLSRRFGMGLLMLAAASMGGCSQASGDDGGDSSEKVGTLGLPLTTQGASGVTYRLRDASFVISGLGGGFGGSSAGGGWAGAPGIVVSSESEPDAATISVPLEEGTYLVELQPGWHFEKITSAGAEDVEATLLSGNPQWVWVSRRSTSFAEFQFGLGGREIWLNGELNVGVVLYEDPSELGGYGGAAGAAGSFPGGSAGAPVTAGAGGASGGSAP